MISDYGKGCDFYNFTYKLGLRGDGKRANSFVFFFFIIFFLTSTLFSSYSSAFRAYGFYPQSQFTAFMREKNWPYLYFPESFSRAGHFSGSLFPSE